jgi:hypothetical protein
VHRFATMVLCRPNVFDLIYTIAAACYMSRLGTKEAVVTRGETVFMWARTML